MNKKKYPFPWHYFIREIQSRFFYIVVTAIGIYLVANFTNNSPYLNEIILILSLLAISILFTLNRILPFRKILNRIEVIQEKLPYDKKLDLIYQKNEWNLLEEILSLTETNLDEQSEKLQTQDQESWTLLESIPSGLIIIDKFQNCKKFNSYFFNHFISNKKVSLVENIKLWKVFSNDDLLSAFTKVISDKKVEKLEGFFIPEKNQYYDIAITPLFDSKTEIIGAIGIFHNVTNSKLTEKMRVDFVANVSHEIKTPLTSIKGYSQLLQAQNLDSDTKLLSDKIISNAERLHDLFESLLKLSVLESKRDIKIETINFEDLVKKILGLINGKYLDKEVHLNTQFSIHHIQADIKLIEQVFTNLFDNSIKYGKESIDITIELDDLENHYRIKFSDNGPGISQEDLNRIFERFYRVQEKSDSPIEGSGLGLSIVKHIINKHNGQILVESSFGQGTTFIIELPKL